MGLSACGGGGGLSGGDDGGTDPVDPGTDPDLTPSSITMGTQIGHTFTEGALEITDSTLSSSESTTVSVYLIDEDGELITTGIDRVTFSSTCVEADPATATITSPVTVAAGKATATYQTNGCADSDTITVRATYNGTTLTASGTVTITGEDIIRLGSYVDSVFTDGQLDVSISNLSAGGTASITTYLIDGNGVPILDGTISSVTFTSTFTSAGTASITQSVPVESGRATATYEALGAEGVDTITARAITSSGFLEAQGNITVAAASAGAISFISASPEIIALKGTGGDGRFEYSKVKFQVVNDFGGPVAYTDVNFSLNTNIGELSLTHTTVETDAEGFAQTTVNAGYIPTSIIVTASVASTEIATQSSRLSILSGIPDQDSFTISPTIFNPEIWNYNNLSIPVTVQLADRYNNPVPDGTPITLTTESGIVDGQCFTTDSKCTVNWTSQDPRPVDGRVTILAYATGEESFVDANGNGRFDESWDHDNNPGTPDILEPFTDMPEAWLDIDEDGCQDSGANVCTTNPVGSVLEEYKDFNVNGVFDSPNDGDPNGAPIGDEVYNGKLCNDDSCAAAADSIHVRQSMILVMSGKTPYLTLDPSTTLIGDCVQLVQDTPLDVEFWITDGRGQQMPSTSTVSVSITGTGITGNTLRSIGKWDNTSAKIDPDTPNFAVRVTGTDNTATDGYISVTVITPGRDQNIKTDTDNSSTTVSACLAF